MGSTNSQGIQRTVRASANLDCKKLYRINDPVFSTQNNKKKERRQGGRLYIKEEKQREIQPIIIVRHNLQPK